MRTDDEIPLFIIDGDPREVGRVYDKRLIKRGHAPKGRELVTRHYSDTGEVRTLDDGRQVRIYRPSEDGK